MSSSKLSPSHVGSNNFPYLKGIGLGGYTSGIGEGSMDDGLGLYERNGEELWHSFPSC